VKLFSLLILLLYFSPCSSQKLFTYPPTEKVNAADTLWNKIVEDPYRWLEEINSEKTKEWLKSQEVVTNKYRSKLASNTTEHLSNYTRVGYKDIKSRHSVKRGIYYFSYRGYTNESSTLYYKLDPDDDYKILFDPNTYDKSAITSIEEIDLSEDNKILALTLSKNGSDWMSIRFIDMETRQLLSDSVNFVKYSNVFWSGNGVFYIKYDVKNTYESFTGQIKIKALQFHTIHTSQESDLAIYTPKDRTDDFYFNVTPEKKYLILYQKSIEKNKKIRTLSYKKLPLKPEDQFKEFIISDAKNVYFNVIGEINDKILVASNLKAKNGILYKCDPEKLNSLEKFTPHYSERLKSAAIINNNKIISLYNGDKRSYAVFTDSSGTKLKSVMIPEGFSFSGFSYTRGDSILIYNFVSFFNTSTIYKINLNTFEQGPVAKTVVPFSFKDLTTKMVYYYSKDSTLIPMYLTHKKNMKLDGTNPTILYGYGGFGVSMRPYFDVGNIPFLNSGGLLAVPQLRGGGDFPDWHEQGIKLNKQNTFDDFIAAAEYLIDSNYTNPEKLAGMGGSNGGLLVGACMTQRPELFKVIVSTAGLLDMMRYHLYNIGYKYTEEFGNVEDSLDFENLLKYSPVHNVKKGIDYPATLLVASDNDDRVNPFHSFKFLSHLQANGPSKNPYVLYYLENAGHSTGEVFNEKMKTKGFIYSFIFKYLDMENKIYYED
jgi:prolyl oligopeptidase